jgi:6-phosphogluconate dehydrogenase
MQIGMVGLGRMGANMTRRLTAGGIEVVAFDASDAARAAMADVARASTVDSLPALIGALPAPRIVWMMLPQGEISERTIGALGERLERGDLVVDGANAYYKDSVRHAAELAGRGIGFVDAGVSGGIWGLKQGYAIMAGGTDESFARVLPLVKILAPAADRGWLHCGPPGAGHFVKMVHNGIEYGMMQAYAEGLKLLSPKR